MPRSASNATDRGCRRSAPSGREDLAFGLGFVHGQDRFFQMDGLRRYAAGELAEIFGAGPEGTVVAMDRRVRVMRFRAVAQEVVANLGAAERRQLDAYVEGVRAGSARSGPGRSNTCCSG